MDASYALFRWFLVRSGCEREFDRAFYEQNGSTAFDEAMWLLLGGDENAMARMFDWTATPEGRPFWRRIDEKWRGEEEQAEEGR